MAVLFIVIKPDIDNLVASFVAVKFKFCDVPAILLAYGVGYVVSIKRINDRSREEVFKMQFILSHKSERVRVAHERQ